MARPWSFLLQQPNLGQTRPLAPVQALLAPGALPRKQEFALSEEFRGNRKFLEFSHLLTIESRADEFAIDPQHRAPIAAGAHNVNAVRIDRRIDHRDRPLGGL